MSTAAHNPYLGNTERCSCAHVRSFRWFHLNDIYGLKIDLVREFSENNISVLKIKHYLRVEEESWRRINKK